MIPVSSITAWSNISPWGNLHFVEQDLLLSRMVIDLFNDRVLSEKLAFRGGTALHKLHLNPQPRYSEDIDLIQINPEPIGFIFDRFRDIYSFLDKPKIKQKMRNNTLIYSFISETLPQAKLRVKVEINSQEHENVFGFVMIPFEVQNPWYTGHCNVLTYSIDELIGTKIRALYQRKKGRDLFDIYYAFKLGKLDIEKTIFCYKKYMMMSTGFVPSIKMYTDNLSMKIIDPVFISDLKPLLRLGIEYDSTDAFSMMINTFIAKM